MDFAPTPEQEAIREAVAGICARFDDAWWHAQDEAGEFPHAFHRAIAEAGFLGVCIPEEYGGSGLGIAEAAVMMEAIASSGAGMSGASAVHMNIFGLNPVVVFGSAEQKRRFLPPLVRGEEKACFGVTEPTTGLDTTRLKTRAVRRGDRYVVDGQKVWISTAQVADRILLLARTGGPGAAGLSLFYTALDRTRCSVRAIPKMGRHAVDSNEIFFEGYEVPAEDLIGEEGQGFRQILHGLNPERVLLAAEAVGLGRAALRRAAAYAKERVVFGRPVGQNQAVQHPLAEDWMALEAAWMMAMNAAWRYDRGLDCGAQANAAKFLAGEAGLKACQDAVMTHGGFGYAREYHVERYLREAMIPWITPVSPNMIRSFIAEKVLGLPKSY
ncbi:acyl-CoA dehydrogenase family protein [Roseococcus sp. DSY-14]|uniref:acyl-CoA dehydrogenase family protein n=1 Tax=Roseococcus sp. DSY-14 TaxID=3369650 RepID=UPI00387B75FD